jgi:hypothetical protein
MSKECPVCGTSLPPSRTRPHKFCSHACRTARWTLERRADSLAQRAAEAEAAWAKVKRALGA